MQTVSHISFQECWCIDCHVVELSVDSDFEEDKGAPPKKRVITIGDSSSDEDYDDAKVR